MRIMLVDDSKTMRNIHRAVLHQLGLNDIIEASNGQAALERLADCPVDLIIVDSVMPIMRGLDFVRTLRQTDTATRIIMVTSESDRASVVEAIKAGVDEYLPKPFTPDLLAQRVRETLARPREVAAQPAGSQP